MPDYSYLETTFERDPRAINDAKRFVHYSKINVGGKLILKTSPYYSRSWMAKHFHENSALVSDPSVVVGKNTDAFDDADWNEVANAEGLPEKCPASLWAIENVRNIRTQFFANVVLSGHEMELISKIAASDAKGRPGKYRPIIFEGEAGCGKTQGILSYAALTGKAYMEARGIANDDKAEGERLGGGDLPKTVTRGKVMKEMAHYGIFETPLAMSVFYRECGKIIKDGRASDVAKAYGLITDTVWHDIAGIDGMPDEGDAIAVKRLGLAEIGRRVPGGCIINFDETNVFSEFTEGVVTSNFNNHTRYDQINTVWCGTMNPPSAEYTNRRRLTYDSLSRVEVRPAVKPDLDQLRDLTLRFFGYAGIGEDRLKENKMIHAALDSDKDISAVEKAGLFKIRDRNQIYFQLLTEKSAEAVAASISQFHCFIEPMTRQHGKLHPDSYGSTASPATIDLRTLIDSFFTGLGPTLAHKALEANPELAAKLSFNTPANGEELISCLTKTAIAEGIHEMLQEAYVERLQFTKPGMERAITASAKFKSTDSSQPILEQALRDYKLTLKDLVKVIEINSPEVAPAWAITMAKEISGIVNAKSANPRGLLEAIESANPDVAVALANKDEQLKNPELGYGYNDMVLATTGSDVVIPMGQRVLDDITVEFAHEKKYVYCGDTPETRLKSKEKAKELVPALFQVFLKENAIPLNVELGENGMPKDGEIPKKLLVSLYSQFRDSHMARYPDAKGDEIEFSMLLPLQLPNGKIITMVGADVPMPDGSKKVTTYFIDEKSTTEYLTNALVDGNQGTSEKHLPGAKGNATKLFGDASVKTSLDHRHLFVYTTAGKPLLLEDSRFDGSAAWSAVETTFDKAIPKCSGKGDESVQRAGTKTLSARGNKSNEVVTGELGNPNDGIKR